MAGSSIAVIDHSEAVERLLAPYRAAIGEDYQGYLGHILRDLSYAVHFLGGDDSRRHEMEVALAYHDLGLWTARRLDYLEPSIAQALADNQALGLGVDPTVLRNIIHWHHKVFPFHGPDAELINAVRRADWVDASGGKVRMGLKREQIAAVNAAIPEAGFHDALMRLTREISGGHMVRGLGKVLRRTYKL